MRTSCPATPIAGCLGTIRKRWLPPPRRPPLADSPPISPPHLHVKIVFHARRKDTKKPHPQGGWGKFPKNRPGHESENCYPIRPMNRYLATILVGLLLTGCSGTGQTPTSDPFLTSQTRIAPPPTGAAAGQATDPGYTSSPSPSSPSSTRPAWLPSDTTTPPAATAQPQTGASAPTAGIASPQPATTPPPPGFTSKTSDMRGASSATATPPIGATTSGANGRPVAPMGSNANFRGVSLQGSRSAVVPPDLGTPPSTTTSRGGTVLDSRIPRPLDDSPPSGNATPGPASSSGQPSAAGTASGRVMDFTELPTAL
jgi:hypothetical protein